MKIDLMIFIILNVFTFLIYGIDKLKAKADARRISENFLIGSSIFFSSYGALLGMYVFHHKTRKIKFLICIPALVLIHSFIIYKVFFC